MPCEHSLMLRLLKLLFILAVRSFRSRRDLLLENLALRSSSILLRDDRRSGSQIIAMMQAAEPWH
jgi:hypothetical protein